VRTPDGAAKHIAALAPRRDTDRVRPPPGLAANAVDAVDAGDWEQRLVAMAATLTTEVGRSRLGRPILGRTFAGRSCGPGDPVLLVVGAIHGDEPASAGAVWDLGERLAGSSLNERLTVHVVPALNPDGLVARTKNAASDVDLNRNFPAQNFVRAHAPGYDPGPAPLSEPETATLARLIEDTAADGVVSVHAPFGCVNFDGPAGPWAQAVAAACGWPLRPHIGYPTPGSLGSWLGVDRGLPVLTLELPPGSLQGFRPAAAAALDAAVVWWGRGGTSGSGADRKIP
jgi:murein peptide amidase A